jgi:outer membrane protein assembly factor BamD (BamD/ComL family)
MFYNKQISLVIVALLMSIGLIHAQEKYAVLITGDPEATGVHVNCQWNSGQGMGQYGYDEFWNDTYLAWEMLYQDMGYSNDNIFVYYDDGGDFTFSLQDDRYRVVPNFPDLNFITDQSSTKANIQALFTSLAGTLTQDDFLYVNIMSHGKSTLETEAGASYFYSSDAQKIYDWELANWVGNITANRIVFNIQAPRSGGFISELAAANTLVITSSDDNSAASRADNYPVTENEVINNVTYNHGEHNFHYIAAMTGEIPTGATSYNGQNLTNVNVFDDVFVTFSEAVNWTEVKESSNDNPQCNGVIAPKAALDFPTVIYVDITENETFRGIVGVDYCGTDESVYLDCDFNKIAFAENSFVTFHNDTRLAVWNVGEITIEDNVELQGSSGASGIMAYNKTAIGKNVLFHATPGNRWGALDVAGSHPVTLEQVSFEDCYLIANIRSLTIDDCRFVNSGIRPLIQNLTLTNSLFSNSFVQAIKIDANFGKAKVDNCQFTCVGNLPNNNTWDAIMIMYHDDFQVTNCTVDGFKGEGINVVSAGAAPNALHLVQGNSVTNCASTPTNFGGITFFHSYATVKDNYSSGNYIGLISTANSSIEMTIDHHQQSQRIINNQTNQIWATDEAFPYLFRLNEVHGTNYASYYAVYMQDETNCLPKDIRYNCWGSNFDPTNPGEFFYPLNKFVWSPVWNCSVVTPPVMGAEETMFNDAQAKIDSKDYAGAKADLELLVETYPTSSFAVAAIKELYTIESELSTNYSDLKDYYDKNVTIQSNVDLQRSAGKLSIDCLIKDGEYQRAIEMLEAIINDPNSTHYESLYAQIQLQYIDYLINYHLNKSSIDIQAVENPFAVEQNEIGQFYEVGMSELIKKDEDKPQKEFAIAKEGELLQNVPNPFSGSTQIDFRLNVEADVRVNVYNNTGQLIKSLNEGRLTGGVYSTYYNSGNLPSGVYYYTLLINQAPTQTRKMIIQ